jgi:ubiquinone/menaquinone biosynthesis C-methylase UbiE
MDHTDHLNLLRPSLPDAPPGFPPDDCWADYGSGSGAFTLALADLLGPAIEIYSIDRDPGALKLQKAALQARFPTARVHYLAADFTQPLALPPLTGAVMANALHFHRRKEPILRQIYAALKPGGRLIIIEYNIDQGNPWVPYPFSFQTWKDLAQQSGFQGTRLLATRPSRFLKEIYSALSWKEP